MRHRTIVRRPDTTVEGKIRRSDTGRCTPIDAPLPNCLAILGLDGLVGLIGRPRIAEDLTARVQSAPSWCLMPRVSAQARGASGTCDDQQDGGAGRGSVHEYPAQPAEQHVYVQAPRIRAVLIRSRRYAGLLLTSVKESISTSAAIMMRGCTQLRSLSSTARACKHSSASISPITAQDKLDSV